MTRATYGVVLGLVGSAIGFWIWSRNFSEVPEDSRGIVIYRNTPTASEGI